MAGKVWQERLGRKELTGSLGEPWAEGAPPAGKQAPWSRERLLVVVLFLATALAFVICYLLAQPFLPSLAWALALALIANPLYDWLARRVQSRDLAAALAVLIVAIAVVAPAIYLTQRIVREAAHGVAALQNDAASGRWRAVVEQNPRLAPVFHWVSAQVDVRAAAERITGAITSRASDWVKDSLWMLAELLITFFFLFYFFRDRNVVVGAFRSLVPLSNVETDEVFRRVSDTVYATVYGTLVAAVQGALGGLMFWWLGLPAPLLWGVAMGLFAVVPVLGAFVIWVPAALFLALSGSWGKALILTVWGGVIVSLIDNLLYPVLVGKRLRLHTVPVFVALVGGLTLFGAAGLILGPVVLAITVALVDIWRRRTANGRTAETRLEETAPPLA
jgi:predicted PurR-regulated permease PerM